MRPLKVTATMAGEIAGPQLPMLDALMEWCMSRHVGRGIGITHDNIDRTPYAPGLIPSPIARRRVVGFGWPIPLCSSPISAGSTDAVEHYSRRFDVEPELIRAADRRVFQASGGEFKSYRLPLRTQLIDRIAWLCVGDRKEIRRLLRDVSHLGKKTAQGFGRVAEWSVEHWDAPEDSCWFASSNAGTVLMRPMPSAAITAEPLQGFRLTFGGVVPPYWASEYFVESAVPC